MAATGGRPLRCSVVQCSHFYWRRLTRNTLPLAVGHLHPRIGPALMNIERLSRRIGALTFEASRRDGRIAEYCHFHIVVVGTVPFGLFISCQRLGLAGDFPIGLRNHDFVGQQWGDQVRIICLLCPKPLLFQCRDSFLGPAAGLLVLRSCGAHQRKQNKQTPYPGFLHSRLLTC
jgi:hypothetical protein